MWCVRRALATPRAWFWVAAPPAGEAAALVLPCCKPPLALTGPEEPLRRCLYCAVSRLWRLQDWFAALARAVSSFWSLQGPKNRCGDAFAVL